MNALELHALACDCYAAFNASAPGQDSRAMQLWAEMCAKVPLQAGRWIRGKIIEQDSLPRNFGKAVYALYHDWLAANPLPQRPAACCPSCDAQIPGFFFTWSKQDGRLAQRVAKCVCNVDPAFAGLPGMDKYAARERGFFVRPHGWKRSLGEFEREVLGVGKRGAAPPAGPQLWKG